MYALRKWMFKPKKSDASVLAQFFHADEALNQVAAELDSFDGRKDPERCNALVNKLRHCQDKVLNVVEKIIQQVVPIERESRDFRVKFPDDVLQESLAGQLWFGAECLAAGSSIMNREVESASMRPLAKSLTQQLDHLRTLLRDQCLKANNQFTDKIKEALLVFDKLFAEFELGYVSAMVPVKTMKEYDMLQEVTVLFCETVQRALRLGLLTQDMIDYYDPALMFTIPRLAIVCGLLIHPEGPINPDKDPMNMSEMFRPFQMLLYKIRELLWTLSRNELWLLEKALSSTDDNVPLTDQAFQQQLNRLNLQSRSSTSMPHASVPHTSTSVHAPSGPESPGDQGILGHAPSGPDSPGDQGILSHSPSTQTVVTVCSNGDNDTTTDRPDHDSHHHPPSCCLAPTVPHQDSTDSGMLSLSDQPVAGDSTDSVIRLGPLEEGRRTTRSLQKARSWPVHKRNSSSSQRARCQRQTSSGDSRGLLASVELLDVQLDVQRVLCTQSMGSREFSFNLPQNTGRGQGECVEEGSGEGGSAGAQGSDQGQTQDTPASTEPVLYTQGNCDQIEQAPIPPHVAYIRGALNSAVLRGPQFEGVAPPRDYNSLVSTNSHVVDVTNAQDSATDRPKRTLAEISSQYKSQSCDSRVSGATVQNQRPSSARQTTCDTLPSKDCCSEPQSTAQDHCPESSASRDSGAKILKYSAVSGRQDTAEVSSSPELDWDQASSDTSSCTSDSLGDEEIVLAIQAAEVAARRDARARFKSSSELIHKLFVCISGVADQLQTNYASDFRHILKSVFECHSSQPEEEEEELETSKDKIRGASVSLEGQDSHRASDSSSQDSNDSNQGSHHGNQGQPGGGDQNLQAIETAEAAEPPPDWIPDDQAPLCSACEVPFTFVRRRHHCRNCGKVFCGRCSSNNVSLPHYGHCKPVRVCNHCYMFQVTPFTVLGG